MNHSLPQRAPQNASGDFYVDARWCLRCGLPHGQAPELLNDPNEPFEACYFRRQPQTPEEIDHAIKALCVSETCALRYGGADESIVQTLRERGCAHLCDGTAEGRAWLTPQPKPGSEPSAQRRRWWRRLFGGAGKAK